MPRRLRVSAGGFACHVLNRAVARERIFRTAKDYEAFERVLGEAQQRLPRRLLAWCVLPDHWHLTPTEAEWAAVRRSVVRGSPFGAASWQEQTAKRLHLESTLRARGRPRKAQPQED
jgi:hypothetical protein